MKSTSIKLNDSVSIDLSKLIETRLLVQANSGGGKSYAIRRIVEQAFDNVQIIILDPEGEFTNLRERYDFVYAGKGGDVAVESRSAAKLAEKLLELKASTIIDLYELPPQERKHFVRLFCEAMVNSPKELWHDTLIIIDEAHVFAPEKGESEAMGAVIDLATRGRKRGYCVVLATQRLPKLAKDAAAECNNKLIGRASQDIDRKRAAEELGFTTRDEIISLRDLEPGEFFTFGPAISREVIKIKIGPVSVIPPKRGSTRSFKAPPPSAAVKKILGALKDIPQEAAKEAQTVNELKVENMRLKRSLAEKPHQMKVAQTVSSTPMGVSQWRELGKKLGYWDYFETQIKQAAGLEWERVVAEWERYAKHLLKVIGGVVGLLGGINVEVPKLPAKLPPNWLTPSNLKTTTFKNTISGNPVFSRESMEATTKNLGTEKGDKMSFIPQITDTGSFIGKGAREILNAIAASEEEGMTTEHIAVLTGYKKTSRQTYLQQLTSGGYARREGELFFATEEGIAMLGNEFRPLPTGQALRDHVMATLPEGEKRVLSAVMNEGGADKEYIMSETNYKKTSVQTYVQKLSARKLVEVHGGLVVLSEKLRI